MPALHGEIGLIGGLSVCFVTLAKRWQDAEPQKANPILPKALPGRFLNAFLCLNVQDSQG